MAQFVLKDVDIYGGPVDFSCVSTNVNVETTVEELDATTFCSDGWKVNQAGLKSWTIAIEGFTSYSDFESATPGYNAGTEEAFYSAIQYANLEATTNLFTVAPQGPSSEPVYFGNGKGVSYSHGGEVGALQAFSFNASGASASGLMAGQFLAPKDIYNSIGVVASYDNGAALAGGSTVYVGAHILNSTFDAGDFIKVFSSTTVGFGSPTERASWSPEYASNSSLQSVTGVTDRYWRVEYDLSVPTEFLVVIAIVG